MSIYVYISRRAGPLDEGGPSIAASEWLSVIEKDSTLRVARQDESEWLGRHARIWSGHQHSPAFDWVNGQIEVKDPDGETIAKMKELAAKLQASVFSESGELFDNTGGHAGFLPGFP